MEKLSTNKTLTEEELEAAWAALGWRRVPTQDPVLPDDALAAWHDQIGDRYPRAWSSRGDACDASGDGGPHEA